MASVSERMLTSIPPWHRRLNTRLLDLCHDCGYEDMILEQKSPDNSTLKVQLSRERFPVTVNKRCVHIHTSQASNGLLIIAVPFMDNTKEERAGTYLYMHQSCKRFENDKPVRSSIFLAPDIMNWILNKETPPDNYRA